MIGKRLTGAVAGALLLVASLAPRAYSGVIGSNGIRHVLLISIDGMHVLDYLNCKTGSYCPNLTALGTTGVQLSGHFGLEALGFLSRPDVDNDGRNAAHDGCQLRPRLRPCA
jgi:hypothetical protein